MKKKVKTFEHSKQYVEMNISNVVPPTSNPFKSHSVTVISQFERLCVVLVRLS